MDLLSATRWRSQFAPCNARVAMAATFPRKLGYLRCRSRRFAEGAEGESLCPDEIAVVRRTLLAASLMMTMASRRRVCAQGPAGTVRELVEVTDPETYSALVYSPPSERNSLPPLVVLPGAGRNDKEAWDLANLKGEHGGLIPSLIASGQAPKELTENFCVVAPYAAGKKSFYEEPRKKMLAFIEWFCRSSPVDTSRIFLFGFSDGATEVMELASTRRFAGCIVCSYGFTGDLPALACERLKNIPVWVFHCADDVIFPVKCSDKLVKRLKEVNSRDVVRYSRFDKDQEGFTGSVRGHSSGITASRSAEIYSWLLALPKLQA